MIQLFLFVGAAFGLYRFAHLQTAGFSVQKISSNAPNEARWETSPPQGEEARSLQKILGQPFIYLGKGAQCYVFASEDGQAVIKFFRVSHLEAPFWLTALPLPASLEKWRQEKISSKTSKREKDFASYLFAYNQLKEETGLLYLHLNKSSFLQQKVTLVDKIGVRHELDLDDLAFILQRRATPFYAGLEAMIARKEVDRVKVVLADLVGLFQKRRSLGLSDKDPDLKTNFGLIDGVPVQFDIGRFKKGDFKQEPLQDELLRITDECKIWLRKQDPSLADYLDEKIGEAGKDV